MKPDSGFEFRPRGIGELLDLTLLVYRERVGVFAFYGVLASICQWLLGLIGGALMGNLATASDIAPSMIFIIYGWSALSGVIVAALFGMVAMPIMATTDDVLHGRPTSIGQAGKRGIPRFGWVVLTVLLQLLITIPFALCFCVPALIPTVILVLAVPVVYFEKARSFAALRRSTQMIWERGPRDVLQESNAVRALVLLIGTGIVTYSLNLLAALPAMIVFGIAIGSGQGPEMTALGPQFGPLALTLPLGLMGQVISGLFLPVVFIIWGVFYYEIRVRHEGLDLEMGIGELASESA